MKVYHYWVLATLIFFLLAGIAGFTGMMLHIAK